MNDGFIADASIGVSWTVPAKSTAATEALLDGILSGASFVVPPMWMVEVANSLLVLMRRRLLAPEECARARNKISGMSLVIDEDGPRLALGKVFDLSTEHGLTVYDAAYLELALRRELPLASRDSALKKAAKRCGVKLLL